MNKEEFRCEDAAREIVLDAILQHTGIPVSASDSLADLDLDSLERTELLIELADGCDHALHQVSANLPEIELDDKEYHKVKMVEDLIQMIANRLQQAIVR
jgi:acyl carrier protein